MTRHQAHILEINGACTCSRINNTINELSELIIHFLKNKINVRNLYYSINYVHIYLILYYTDIII